MKKYLFLFFAMLSLDIMGMEKSDIEQETQEISPVESIPDELLVMIFEREARDCFFSDNGVSSDFKLNNLGKSCNRFLDLFGTLELVCKRFNRCSNFIIRSWALMNLDDELKDMRESRSNLTVEFLGQLKFLSPTVKIRALNFMVRDYTHYIFLNRFSAGLKQTYFWLWVYVTKSKKKLKSFFEDFRDVDIASFGPEELERHCNEIIGLLVSGANPNELIGYKYKDKVEKGSLLGIAIKVKEWRNLIRLLLFRRFYLFQEVDLDVQDSKGRIPLMISLSENNYDLAKTLLATGANPNICDKEGETALILAIRDCLNQDCLLHSNVLNILFDFGIDLDARGKDGATALIWAIIKKYEPIVGLLIKQHVKMDAFYIRYNALGWAIVKYQEKIVQMLLEAGADINRVSRDGDSAIEVANMYNYNKAQARILQMLKAKDKELNSEIAESGYCTIS